MLFHASLQMFVVRLDVLRGSSSKVGQLQPQQIIRAPCLNRVCGLHLHPEHAMMRQLAKRGSVVDACMEKRCCMESSAPAVSYTHLRAHETDSYLVCRLLLEKK